MAASMALPPLFRILTPASTASGWLLATIPFLAITTERRAAKPARSTRLVSNMRLLLSQAATERELNGRLSYAGEIGKSKINQGYPWQVCAGSGAGEHSWWAGINRLAGRIWG